MHMVARTLEIQDSRSELPYIIIFRKYHCDKSTITHVNHYGVHVRSRPVAFAFSIKTGVRRYHIIKKYGVQQWMELTLAHVKVIV